MKYDEWLGIWLQDYVRPAVKTRTYDRYSFIAFRRLGAALGGSELGAMTALKLQRFITGLSENGNMKTGEGLSANSVNCVISVLQASLRTAEETGLVSGVAAIRLKRPKLSEKRVECFSIAEQKKIERAVLSGKKDKLYGILLCLYSGLRIGELLALTWRDIDLVKGVMSVSKSCYDYGGGQGRTRIIDSPKTARSRRVIPLPKQILPLLKAWKKRSSCEYLVADGTKPVFVRSYQRTFELLLKKLEIPHKGFHSLRHTFATRALECGMDVKTLSEILGHKNPTVTLNRYAHSLMEHKKDMMNRLGKLLQ